MTTGPMMNKAALVAAIAEKSGLTKAQAAAALDAATSTIAQHAEDGGTVAVPGFGRFQTRTRKPFIGRDPRTGQPIDIPASSSLGFRASRNAKK